MTPLSEYYKVKTSYCNYYAEVRHQYPGIDKVYFGGKKKCVAFSVYLDEPWPNLDGIGYDPDCNISGTLEQGKGTRHMILSAFEFINSIYGPQEKVLLKDTSTINCNGYDMSLACYYLLYYGSTYYQKHFQAVPFEKSLEEYKQDVSNMRSFLKTKPHADELFHTIHNKKRKGTLTMMYDKCNSIQEFITNIKGNDCNIFRYWGESIVYKHVPYLNGLMWSIDIHSLVLPKISYDIIKNKPLDMFVGGGHYSFKSGNDH